MFKNYDAKIANLYNENRIFDQQLKQLKQDINSVKAVPVASSDKREWTEEKANTIDRLDKTVKLLLEELGYEVVNPSGVRLVKKQK